MAKNAVIEMLLCLLHLRFFISAMAFAVSHFYLHTEKFINNTAVCIELIQAVPCLKSRKNFHMFRLSVGLHLDWVHFSKLQLSRCLA